MFKCLEKRIYQFFQFPLFRNFSDDFCAACVAMESDDALNLKSLFEEFNFSDNKTSMVSAKPFAHRMQTLFHTGELTDVTFHVGDTKEEFCAHRVVLATISPAFRSMLFGDLFDPTQVIIISDVSEKAFRNILKQV